MANLHLLIKKIDVPFGGAYIPIMKIFFFPKARESLDENIYN